uniref:Uncharacterized protein n=1 Tax=Sphenodon punctatus TaxID=8508 RepID=A0A8D0GR37_SPHPU
MKALLNPNNNSHDITLETVKLLITEAEISGCLEELLNAAYTAKEYEGQTALHIAIEKQMEQVASFLVDKGADVHSRARGLFFQLCEHRNDCFYFGESSQGSVSFGQ